MALTITTFTSITHAALDFYLKGPAIAQNLTSKPLARDLTAKQKTFPGGNTYISRAVQGAWAADSAFMAGYTQDDAVSYVHPDNLLRAKYTWIELHAGINLTMTELKQDGISVVDSLDGKSTSKHSDRESTAITNLLENKLNDMGESWAIDFNEQCWKDGTQAAIALGGLTSILSDTPAVGTTGALNRATYDWWRHQAYVGATKIAVSAENQTLTRALRQNIRQLMKYGGKPTKIYAGSGFLAAAEYEYQAKGSYTMTGFDKSNSLGMGSLNLMGIEIEYDPTMDTLGYTNRAYAVDLKKIVLEVMEGEDKKAHNPARPYDQYVILKAMTWTGGLCAWQLNTSAVWEADFTA